MIHRTFGTTAGVVLAGTHPWNHSPFDALAPRPLLLVAHRPLVSYALSWLQRADIRDVVLCANRETRDLRAQLTHHIPSGMTLVYHEDAMPRGSAGCVRDASSSSGAETFVVADGTAIQTLDIGALLKSHHESDSAVTVVVHPETSRNGEPGRQVPSGVYVFSRRALAEVRSQGFFDIKENLIPLLYASGERISVYPIAEESPRVMDMSSYLAVDGWTVQCVAEAREHPTSHVGSRAELIDRSAQIDKGAVVVGPVLVGPRVRVLQGATIIGPASIGAESVLDRGAVVSRSAVWRRCVIGRQAVADRCVLGDDSVVRPGTRVFGMVRLGVRERNPEELGLARHSPSLAALLRRRFASLNSSDV